MRLYINDLVENILQAILETVRFQLPDKQDFVYLFWPKVFVFEYHHN